MKKISLLHLKAGHKGKVAEITGSSHLQNKLMGMGIFLGRDITKFSHFALRGPVAIKVGRAVIALGHNLAAKIIIESND